MKQLMWTIPAMAVAVCLATGVATAGTLDDVKAKGFIQAGVNGEPIRFW